MKKLKMSVNSLDRKSHINREIYGHFSEHLGRCIYGGIYVGENSPIPNTNGIRNDVIDAFRQIKMPVLRWPGGCFADEYHWKDGIGDKASRKKMVNTNWGGVSEDNSFGTHEFMELCELVGCEPYIAGNLGSGTVQELAEWVEYMTSEGGSPISELRKKNGREKPWKLKYLGIGNENWGCGGSMRPEYYADEYRRYQSFCKNFSGNSLYKVACGPSADDYNWTDVLMKNIGTWGAGAISLHYYTIPTGDWGKKGSSTDFSTEEYYSTIEKTMYIDELITRHDCVMNRYDAEKKVGIIVDEWGCWYDVEPGTNPGFLYQQNTMRDAIVAAINLNIFNNHSDRVVMANLAQAVNVLQAVVLTEGEKLIKTPTFHVFDLYKTHQDGELVYSWVEDEKNAGGTSAISQSASVKDGVMTVTLANTSLDEEYEIECDLYGFEAKSAVARILSGDVYDYNDFDNADKVAVKDYSVDVSDGRITVKLPKCSVVSVVIE